VKAAIYARVSTVDQEPENQLRESRVQCKARGWTAVEYVDRRVSGTKDRPRSRYADSRRQAAAVRCRRVLATRSARSQPEALDHTAGGFAGARGRVRQLGGRHRRHDARREAPDAHPWCNRGVRKGTHPRARARWPPAGEGTRHATRQATEGADDDRHSRRQRAGRSANLGRVEVNGRALDRDGPIALGTIPCDRVMTFAVFRSVLCSVVRHKSSRDKYLFCGLCCG
jgi:hypothetical protein